MPALLKLTDDLGGLLLILLSWSGSPSSSMFGSCKENMVVRVAKVKKKLFLLFTEVKTNTCI